MNILEDHAVLEFENGKLFLKVMDDLAAENTFLNGKFVPEDKNKMFLVELSDMDRLIFGGNTTFLVRLPEKGEIN